MTFGVPMASAATDHLRQQRSVVATRLVFWINGLMIGGYGATLPSIRERLGVAPAAITALLLATGMAALVAIQFSGRLSDKVGARRVTLAGFSLLIAAVGGFAVASSLTTAVAAALVLGLGNGLMDVAMNALAVQLESARARPLIGSLHAFWSVGGLMASGLLLAVATAFQLRGSAVVPPFMSLLVVTGVMALVLAWRTLPPVPRVVHPPRVRGPRVPALAWLLGLVALGMGLSEGTATDWSALHVTEVAAVDSTTGAVGFVAVSACMVLIRFLGDPLVARFGRRPVVRVGAICATVGYVAVSVVSDLVALVGGWALVGLGVGILAPQIYAVAGHTGGGRMLSMVVSFGYVAFLVGPAILGAVILQVGLALAMLVPAAVCALTIIAAGVIPPTASRDTP